MAKIFDIETNGLLMETNVCHVLVIKDTITKQVTRYTAATAFVGVKELSEATFNKVHIVAHNGIKFDIPALQKLYPWFTFDPEYIHDTLVMTRLMFPDLLDHDRRLIEKGLLSPKLLKRHSLEAWGCRLGERKIDYMEWCANMGITEPFAKWSQEMEDYCVQDVISLERLYEYCLSQNYPQQPIVLEHQVQWIIARQERYGFLFDMKAASELYGKLVEHRARLDVEVAKVFHPIFIPAGKRLSDGTYEVTVPKVGNKTRGITKDAPYTKMKVMEFNPGSRDHVTLWFKRLFRWIPKEFTNDGKAKVDDKILNALPYPEAKVLAEYYMVLKRIGQVAEGDQAWFRHVQSNGRIHGSVITNGAVTGRMTHSHPNMAQVPASKSPYGHDCRAVFIVPFGKKLVGADAAALELRCFAGYMALWDNGDYIKVILEGKKELGTEIHSVNRKALGIDSRDVAKTWFYAFLYGAGDEKLGTELGAKPGAAARKLGKASREKFLKSLPALGKLVEMVQLKVKKQKFLKGLDGRVLHVRSAHAALNTLLQSAGAILMKQALVFLDHNLQQMGFIPGVHYEFVANVHDEWQIEVNEDIAEQVGKSAVEAMEQAGRHFKFRCPITGEYGIGSNWSETH